MHYSISYAYPKSMLSNACKDLANETTRLIQISLDKSITSRLVQILKSSKHFRLLGYSTRKSDKLALFLFRAHNLRNR